ncbi:MAG: bifunctional DNA-formamidopyrimidine glycosylase/DNA-(apurinic or apyrimidinic site) lyase [Candidatus Acidiferrales bacterium]
MPELPEVETVVRGLRETLPGRRILAARLGKTDFIDDPAALEQHVPGKRIEAVRRMGKFLVFDLNSGAGSSAEQHHLIVHLGMTGQLITIPREAPAAAHTHVYFELDDGRDLRYIDPRRFGRMALVSAEGQQEVLGRLGVEPLEISEDQFRTKLAGRRARIKALLLDQSVLRGMGNIYSDECLWWARIHPSRLAANLDPDAVHRLHKAVRKVLNEAIAKRGSSISNYRDSNGDMGEFQARHRVYQRTGKKCFRCGTLIRHNIVAGRSTHFCPQCQPAPRTRTPAHQRPATRKSKSARRR